MSSTTTDRLGHVATFIRGINFKPDDVVPVGAPGSVACMRTKNVQTNLDLSDVWGIPESFVKRGDQFLGHGDIIVSSANSWNLVGKCCWVPELPWRSSFGGFVSVLRADPRRIDPRYLFHWFASERVQTTVRSFGQQTTNISNLNIERCLDLSLPLPPLSEQRRIASILDQADALRAKRRTALAQLDTLAQSIFLEMFGDPVANPKGWNIWPVGSFLADVTNGLTRRRKSDDEGRDVVLRLRDIRDGWIDLSQVNRISLTPQEAERYRVAMGDLLFIRVNGNPDFVGRCAIFEGTRESVYFNDHIMRVKLDASRVNGRFLVFVLNGPRGKNEIALRRKTSAGQHTINQEGLSNIVVPLPPLFLQREFGSRLAGIENLRAVQEACLTKLDELFASLQHRAFRGEL